MQRENKKRNSENKKKKNPMGVFEIFRWVYPSDRTVAFVSAEPLTETSTRYIHWG